MKQNLKRKKDQNSVKRARRGKKIRWYPKENIENWIINFCY